MPVAGLGGASEPRGHRTATAHAVNSPGAIGAALYVTVPVFGPERSLVLGWAYKSPLPKAGDECLVTYDEHNNPWVVAWR